MIIVLFNQSRITIQYAIKKIVYYSVSHRSCVFQAGETLENSKRNECLKEREIAMQPEYHCSIAEDCVKSQK